LRAFETGARVLAHRRPCARRPIAECEPKGLPASGHRDRVRLDLGGRNPYYGGGRPTAARMVTWRARPERGPDRGRNARRSGARVHFHRSAERRARRVAWPRARRGSATLAGRDADRAGPGRVVGDQRPRRRPARGGAHKARSVAATLSAQVGQLQATTPPRARGHRPQEGGPRREAVGDRRARCEASGSRRPSSAPPRATRRPARPPPSWLAPAAAPSGPGRDAASARAGRAGPWRPRRAAHRGI